MNDGMGYKCKEYVGDYGLENYGCKTYKDKIPDGNIGKAMKPGGVILGRSSGMNE